MRTTLPSTTSPCLKLLMSESCSASSSSIVVGSGPSSRARAGAGSSWLLVLAGGRRPVSASAASIGRRDWARARQGPRRASAVAGALAAASRRLARLGCLEGLGVAPRPWRQAPAASVGCVGGDGHLGGGGTGRARRRPRSPRRSSSAPGPAAEAMASGSGAVPPCCSSVKVDQSPVDGFRPRNHERPRALARAVWATMEWSVVSLAPRSAPSASMGLDVALQLSVPRRAGRV